MGRTKFPSEIIKVRQGQVQRAFALQEKSFFGSRAHENGGGVREHLIWNGDEWKTRHRTSNRTPRIKEGEKDVVPGPGRPGQQPEPDGQAFPEAKRLEHEIHQTEAPETLQLKGPDCGVTAKLSMFDE